VRAARQLVRSLLTPPEPPEWESFPRGFQDPDPRVKGWNLESIAGAQRAKWPEVLRLVKGSGPLPVFMWAHDLSRASSEADAVLASYGYVLARAARNKDYLSVLDWGGGIGHYKLIGEALLPEVAVEYHCRDVPALCKAGRELQPSAIFHESDESCFARAYDVVMASGSLEYAEDWKGLTRRLAEATRAYLYIARLQIVHRAESFSVIQQAYAHGYPTEYVSWVVNRPDFLAQVRGLGLSLLREFLVGPGPAIHRAPEACEFRSFLFARDGDHNVR
jgi:putative methyltransferase (TIGR04325 family)